MSEVIYGGVIFGHPLFVNEDAEVRHDDKEMTCLRSAATELLQDLPGGTDVQHWIYLSPSRLLRAECAFPGKFLGYTSWVRVPTLAEHTAFEVARHSLSVLWKEEGKESAMRALDRLYRRISQFEPG